MQSRVERENGDNQDASEAVARTRGPFAFVDVLTHLAQDCDKILVICLD